MRATTFEDFAVNLRVRFFSDPTQETLQGTIRHIDHVSQHVTIAWDNGSGRRYAALEAMHKLEILSPVIPFPSEAEEETLKQNALRVISDSIQRQRTQRARWPEDYREAMSVLANLFPTMRGVPGTNPWNVEKLIAWMNTGAPTSGSWSAAMFLLGVWNPRTAWNKEGVRMRKGATGKFDFFSALGCWDEEHHAAFMEWVANPFWP